MGRAARAERKVAAGFRLCYTDPIFFEKKEGDHGGRKINFGKIQNFFGKSVTNRGSGTLYRVEGVGVRMI